MPGDEGAPPEPGSPATGGSPDLDAERQLRRRFFRLTAYNILANVTVPLAALVDAALLGHLPEIRFLAGVGLAAVLFEYLYWSFGFLRMATTGTTAQAVGRGDRRETYLVLYRSVLIGGVSGIALLALHAPLGDLGFRLLAETSEAVEAAGRDYFGARIWGAPAVLVNFAFLGWFLGREDGRSALAMTLVANLSNIALDYLLIVRLGWAARGAGIATAASQYLMLIAALALFFGRYRPRAWSWPEVADRRRLIELGRLNRDILIRTLALITTFALFVNFSAALGTVTLAANTLLSRLQTFAAYLIDGAAFATETFAGRLRGAGGEAGLRRLRRLALTAGLLFTLPFSAAVLLVPGPLFGLLTSHGPTLATTAAFAWWLAPVLTLGAVAYVYDGLFLGLTAGRALRNSMLISTLAVFLPAALVALRLGDNRLLWASMVAFMAARAGTLAWAFRGLRPTRADGPG